MRCARRAAAHMLVATPRAMGALAESGVRLDVLVRSASDPGEAYEPGMLDPPPRWVVSTRGELGGSWTRRDVGFVGGHGAARSAGRRLRLRRLVRRRARVRVGRGHGAGGGDRARCAVRGGVSVRARAVRGAALAGVTGAVRFAQPCVRSRVVELHLCYGCWFVKWAAPDARGRGRASVSVKRGGGCGECARRAVRLLCADPSLAAGPDFVVRARRLRSSVATRGGCSQRCRGYSRAWVPQCSRRPS